MSKKKKAKKQIKLDVHANNDYVNSNNSFNEYVNNAESPEVFNPSDLFSFENGNSDGLNVSKELFSIKTPKGKTRLTGEEIGIIHRLYVMSKRYYEPRKIYLLKDALDELIILRISLDGKSRAEFVETHKALEEKKNNGLIDGLRSLGGLNK